MERNTFSIDLGDYNVAVHRFGGNPDNPAVVLIHGSIENARVFYSRSGKGFAPWLAKQGFDVFAVDLPGKGESTPKVSRHFKHSQTTFITKDLPAILNDIQQRNHSGELHLGAHSWGGVLIPAMLARSEFNVKSMVFFASKRRISVFHLKRLFMVDLVWTLGGTVLSHLLGFLPARQIKIGSDNEPKKFFLQTNKWVYGREWIDPEDGFNYGEALKEKELPPTLFLCGINDHVLGNPTDVELLMREMPNPRHEIQILGKNYGNEHNYGHIDILTHHGAAEDHFPLVADWFRQYGGNS